MKELSDWQSRRVRDALRAFHRYGRDPVDGAYFNWKDVHAAIAEHTGVEIGTSERNGAERLRQFVEGIEDKKMQGERRFPKPKAAAMEAIVAFVTHEELSLLTKDELQEYMPGVQAPLRLTEFLRKDCALPIDTNLRALGGHYVTSYPYRDGWRVRSLFLQRPSEEGIVQAVETHDHYVTESAEQALKWLNENNLEKRADHIQYGGWAVITPEDTLMLFLKQESDGSNHRYLCLDDIRLWDAEAFASFRGPDFSSKIDLFLLEHDFGHDFRENNGVKYIKDALENDLFVFERMPGIWLDY